MSSNEERDSIENISSVSEVQELLDQSIQEYKRKNGSATNSPNKKRQTFDDTDATKRKFESLKNTVKKDEETIAVVVGKIINDERLLKVPKIKVAALKFSETARARIVAAGGECITLDQLAMIRPTGDKCVLLQGDRSRREVAHHFGAAPGDDNSKTRPKVESHGRKFEMARGRRKSRFFRA